MNRYTYKAKRKDNGEWVYGSLLFDINKTDRSFIVEDGVTSYRSTDKFIAEHINTYVEIDKDTICQCTSLQDIEGNYIFENDIVEYKTPKYNDKTKRINYKKVKRIVVYDISMGMYCLAKSSEEKDIICSDIFDLKNKIWYCKIIGNKFDEVKE